MPENIPIDLQFLTDLVRNLVDHEEDVKVERIVDERGVLLTLYVNPEDLGRVIGKRGATAESIRTLLRTLGMKNDAHYNLKIADTDDGAGKSEKLINDQDRTQKPSSYNDRESREGRYHGNNNNRVSDSEHDMYNYSRPRRRRNNGFSDNKRMNPVDNSNTEKVDNSRLESTDKPDFVRDTREKLAEVQS